jgi:protein-tyrosine phosphatase
LATWNPDAPGVMTLPSGRLVRGWGLRHRMPDGPRPEFGLYLQSKQPPAMPWPSRWIRWPDWWLPLDPDDARDALAEAHRRAGAERIEVACSGGRGRTGTALACLAISDGIPATDAVDWVRTHYHPRAVETPWQQAYVRRFRP